MTTAMQVALGYDQWGNSPELVCERDRRVLEENTWIRAGDITCPQCMLPYSLHPQVQGALWLRRTCEGTLVKL